jgi:lysophospholipase L1-like esterase
MILKNIVFSSLLVLFFIGGDCFSSTINKSSIVTTQNIGNEIMNDRELQLIKDKVNNADSSAQLIKVLHIGDSHIKAGIFSQQFMEKLNDYYSEKKHGNLFFNFQWFCKIGTKYSDYNELAELNTQLINEQPDLVIISLGVNDAFSGSSQTNFYEKVDHLIKKIKKLSPQSCILIITPSDALKYDKAKGTYLALPEIKNVVNTLVKYANDNGIAYWNLYEVMGGEYSINSWFAKKMVQPDRIHFTAKGYGMLAEWLFTAFINSMLSNSSAVNYNPIPYKKSCHVSN